MTMHSRAVISVEWLGHERGRFAVLICSIANNVLEDLKVVGSSHHGRVSKIDFALTGGGYLVVMTLDAYAALRQRQRNLRAQITQRINRRYGNITFLPADVITKVRTAKLISIAA